MNTELLKEGCYVMAIGMSVVFLFLVLMIYSMGIMSKFIQWINKFFPEEIIDNNKKKENKNAKNNNDAEIALAIAAAIHKSKV